MKRKTRPNSRFWWLLIGVPIMVAVWGNRNQLSQEQKAKIKKSVTTLNSALAHAPGSDRESNHQPPNRSGS